jgi:3D (Asp-Asp-Asp) domain-containing protein
MDERTVDRIEGWDSKPLTGGYAELRELADGGFSGVVRAVGTTLFMLNGRVVGVFGGAIEDFADVDATAYQAPHPSIPLLFAMKEYGGDQQAQYYTNDTPISEAHRTLSDAQFTGYIELSENVLSGDYYVVYYGGRSMSCAFVGNSERLETGDEAFELADDEVGIYQVMDVDIEVTDIPDPSSGGAGGASQSGGATGDVDAGGGSPPAAGDSRSTPDEQPGQRAPDDPTGQGAADAGRDTAGGASGAAHDEPADGGTADVNQQPADGGTADVPDGGAADPLDPGTVDGSADAGRERTGGTDPERERTGGADRERERTGGTDPERERTGGADREQERTGGTDPERTPTSEDRASTDPAPETSRTVDPEPDAREPAVDADPQETGGDGRQADPAAGRSTPEPADGRTEPDQQPAGSADSRTESDQPARDPGDAGSGGAADPEASAGPDEQRAAESPAQHSREEAAADRAVEAASGPSGSSATGTATASEGVPKSETAASDLRVIPSLSPDHTAVAAPGEEAGVEADVGGTTSTGRTTDVGGGDDSRGERSVGTDRTTTVDTGGTDVTERASQAVDVDVGGETARGTDDGGSGQLRQQLAAREDRIEELETALTDLRVQRDGLTDERDRLASEVDRLEAEVADMEAEVEQLRSRLSEGAEDSTRLSPEDALQGTNLFIRYDSKSGGTLEKAHRGEVGAEEVNNNLRLEHHTQFEADDTVVDGEAFDEFLRGTIYREFVEWVVRDLLYEIQDTGHVKGLSEVYEAIPRIDRAELLGDVSVAYTEDGEQYRESRSFDVVLRDRMGNPLIVANINDSRNPADRETMETIIQNGIDVKGSNESLSSSMMVTASFFKPGALEAADEAAGGGLLGRDSKESFVKLNRKAGYHLVLVESREGDFHVNVPEL